MFSDKKRQIFDLSAIVLTALLIGLMSSTNAAACASCGCMLSSDWKNLQFCSTPGWSFDFRWDYIDQDQLRAGTGTITPLAAYKYNGYNEEVERDTRTSYFTLTAGYNFNADWGVHAQIPWVDRSHSTFGTPGLGVPGTPWDGSSIVPGSGAYDSRTSSLGDIKIIGNYQGFTQRRNFGVLFGVKLPTGSYDLTGTSTDPAAPGGAAIDRGLEPGTGTTDGLLGAFYTDNLGMRWGYFAQVLGQSAFYFRDGYKPGDAISATVGMRYVGLQAVLPQLQLNFRAADRDSGINADVYDTGGTLLYVSPGIDVPLGVHLSLYAFLQVPVYQNLNGVQLAPRYTTSFGVHYIL